jgi:biotin carboxylase
VVGVDPSDARKRLLVLGAGPAQLGLLRAARARGLRVVVCDRERGAIGVRFADRHAVVSVEDEEGVEDVARAEAVDGLIAPGIDWPVAIAARIAARLGLPHPLDPETAAAAVSKVRQRERFDERGVPQPRWRLVSSPDVDAELPCVVKPPDRQGQVAISLVRDRADLRPALEAALAASRSGAALVEDLVEGPEVTVNGFSVSGRFDALTVTDRLTGDPPAFGVALAHVWPSEAAVEAAVDAARRAAEALGVRDGPTYTQIRIGADGPRVMEVAARLGGGHDAELCDAALGIDLNALALAAALGRRVDVPPARPAGGACVRFLVAPSGRLLAVEGVREALAVEGVLDAVPYRPPGWRFGPLRAGPDRAGFVLARGGSREEAVARASAAAERIRFLVDAGDSS